MCGIAGFSLNSADVSLMRPSNLAKHLALSIEHRGRDATGMSWTDGAGEVWYTKRPSTATKFVASNLHNEVHRSTATCIIHTRAATQGSPSNPDNNHPIVLESIVGVHNGIIWNDYELFKQHEADFSRQAQVDSEIIFQMLAMHGVPGLEKLQGDASIAWVDTSDPDLLHVAALGGRPLVMGETANGSVIFASEARCITDTLARFTGVRLTETYDVPEGTYITVKNGEIQDIQEIPSISYSRRTWSAPKSSGVITTTQPKRQISDAEMTLAVQNLFGDEVSLEDGDAYTKAVDWIRSNVPDPADLLWDDDAASLGSNLEIWDAERGEYVPSVWDPSAGNYVSVYDPKYDWIDEGDEGDADVFYYDGRIISGSEPDEDFCDFPVGDPVRQEAFARSLNEMLVYEALTASTDDGTTPVVPS